MNQSIKTRRSNLLRPHLPFHLSIPYHTTSSLHTMSRAQGGLALGAAIGFGCLFAGFKVIGKNYGTKMPVLRDFDRATNFHDPQFAASFVAGLIGSLVVLYFSFAGASEYARV